MEVEIRVTPEGDGFAANAYGWHGQLVEGRAGETEYQALRSLFCALHGEVEQLAEIVEALEQKIEECDRRNAAVEAGEGNHEC